MANLIAVMGMSGGGKSTSMLKNDEFNIKGLDPKETFVINVSGKPLPGRGSMKLYSLDKTPNDGGNHIILKDPHKIAQTITYVDQSRKDIKNLIVDDAGYIMGFDVMDNINTKGFDKWTGLAANFMKVINAAKSARMDLNVIFTFHTEMGKDEKLKIKTAGAMIDNTIYLDGLFTIILEAAIRKEGEVIKFVFLTRTNGNSTCKSPAGMFSEEFIPNDLGFVLDEVESYYNGE